MKKHWTGDCLSPENYGYEVQINPKPIQKILIRMRFIFVFLFVCASALMATTVAQNANSIYISVKNGTIRQVMQDIEAQTNYSFVYNLEEVNLDKRVSVDAKNKTLAEVLEMVLDNHAIGYKLTGKHIALYRKPQGMQQKSRPITGVVTDLKGEPIIGANIVEMGTTNGTVTDFNGHFTLEASGEKSLKVSYIGYVDKVVNVAGNTNLNIVLAEDSKLISEVVVVGYGTQKKVNLTGAVESVDAKTIDSRPIKSVSDALQGNVPGLTVQSGTGRPGSFATFEVRGKTSVNSAGALVIIDGMPGNINQVNPQDIENISILKDAASSAIYGARAAEGVILVTTKQGNSDKVKIEYSGNLSFNTPSRLPESNTGLNHALLSNQAFSNAGLAVLFPDNALEAIRTQSTVSIPKGNDFIYTADMDWISLMFDHSFQQNHNLTISKAADKLKYLFSAGWLDQDGMFSEYGPDNYDRINIRSNVNIELIKDILSLDARTTFTSTNNLYHPQFSNWSVPYMTYIQCGPNMPIKDENGNWARYRMQGNPIQALGEGGEGRDKQQNIEGVFSLAFKPVKGLTLKAVGGAIIENSQVKEWRRQYGKYGPNGLISMGAGQYGPNRITQYSQNSRYLTGQVMADYALTKGAHELNLLGGWSAEEKLFESINAERTGIVGNELPALNLGSTDGWSNSANETDWALLSGFMRLNYAYASKYLLEVNFRADASSRFSSKNKWGVFPSASLGWRITEEEFMKEQSVFSNLKLRMSWGQLGNQNGLGLYDHIAQYTVNGYYPFGKSLGQWAVLSKLPSESRTWETVEMKNIALETAFLNNRLSLTGEYFIKNNKDMLVSIEVPSVIGINVPTGNFGELEVKGWELSLGWNDQINDFRYSAKFNLSDQKDKLVDFGVAYNGFVAGVNQRIQGYSLGSIFGYDTDGYFQTKEEVAQSAVLNRSVAGPGDVKYIDKDGDGKITAPNDLVYLGTTMPRLVFGLNLDAEWKGFDLNLLFQGVGKRNYYLNRQIMGPFSDTWGNFSYEMHNDYWTPENPNAMLPRHYAGSSHNYQVSKHWLQNAAYMRLKNLQLGYTFSKELTRKAKIERLRIYFSGDNLFEISKLNKNFDPELSTIDGFAYPVMRNLSFGVNVTL